MTTIHDILNELPDLAAEVLTTWHTPNPEPRADLHTRTIPGSRPPIRLDVWDALRPDTKGDLALLHGWCLAIDEDSDQTLGPIPETHPTWTGVTRYLSETWHWWEGTYWADNCLREITTVWRTLQRLARVPQPSRYRCDQCDAPAHPQPGGQWMLCENGHQLEGLGAVRSRLLNTPPLTAKQIHDQWGIEPGDIRRWKHAGLITPVAQTRPAGKGRPADLWNIYDVLQAQRGVPELSAS